jgi:hypothetical protein
MHKDIKWSDREIEGLSFDDLNKITVGKLDQQEAGYAKTDFLALKPELVYKLAKNFDNAWAMVTFKGENQEQIRSAGNLFQQHKLSRPKWFVDGHKEWFAKIDHKEKMANVDFEARTAKIDYKNIFKNTDWEAINAKVDYKKQQEKRIANTDFKAAAAKRNYKAISEKRKKSILQFDLQGNFIKEWSCAEEAAIALNINKTAISACCNGKIKKSGGFIWKYKENKNNI